MKKLSSMARVVEIFQTEPVEHCQLLLEAAQTILKTRRKGDSPAAPKRRSPKSPELPKEASE